MENYNQFIAPERRSVPTPKRFVENGKCVFGTFDKEFEHIQILVVNTDGHLGVTADFVHKWLEKHLFVGAELVEKKQNA